MNDVQSTRLLVADFPNEIPAAEWVFYRQPLELMIERNIPFAIGGGLAYSAYARRWRDTKDIDLFILPSDRDAAVAAVVAAGFSDLYPQHPYDRGWIFRGTAEGLIVDLIWQMANRRAPVDEAWLAGPGVCRVRGLEMRLLPVEELIWSKLYVLQRDRCDWPDLLNLIYVQGEAIDWRHLLERVGEDATLLGGVVAVLEWMCPSRAGELPEWIWPRLGLEPPQPGRSCESMPDRIAALDSRDWFGPRIDGGSP